MSGEYIDRKEFHNTLTDLKKEIKEERKDLREDIQGMKETLNNGVKTKAEQNRSELKEVNDKLNEINSKLDKAEGGLSGLKMAGAILVSAITSVGGVVAVLKALGALSHWT
jgi:chromosome segregation ATPase